MYFLIETSGSLSQAISSQSRALGYICSFILGRAKLQLISRAAKEATAISRAAGRNRSLEEREITMTRARERERVYMGVYASNYVQVSERVSRRRFRSVSFARPWYCRVYMCCTSVYTWGRRLFLCVWDWCVLYWDTSARRAFNYICSLGVGLIGFRLWSLSAASNEILLHRNLIYI